MLRDNPKRSKTFKILLVSAFWLAVWQLIYQIVQQEILIVSPAMVFSRLFALVGTAKFWMTTLSSLSRIMLGYLYALVAGTALAVLCSRFTLLRETFSPLLNIIKSTPVASFIILALVWVKTGSVSILISFLMVLPSVWGNLMEGIKNVDKGLLEMAKVYQIRPLPLLRCVYFPSLLPYFMSAARTSLGFAWKSGIAAEVISVPKLSIGTQLYHAKIYIETSDLFAWTVVVIVLSVCLEGLMVRLMSGLENRLLGRKRGDSRDD